MKECKMKVKFTKASKKDFNLVTVSLTALGDAGVRVGETSLPPAYLEKGYSFCLTIYQGTNGNRRKVIFTVNRAERTATCINWTLNNRPRVGKGVLYSVASKAELI
jgi:hypothetical protein